MIEIAGLQVQLKNEYTLEKNATEDRAGGTLTVFSVRAERFEMYDLVEITENTTTEQYLVQSDNVTKYDEGRYEHIVNLVECAAKFDAYYPADRTHSRIPPRSIGAVLNVYATELSSYHNLQINWDFQADWAQVPIRNKEYEGVNFSVILQDLFREIDARPFVNYVNNKWEITPYFFNFRNNEIDRFDYPNSQIRKQNNMDYATKVKAKLKNAVNTLSAGVYFPSPNGYILPKSSSPQKIQSNLRYELDSGIVEIEEVIAVDVTIKSTSNSITVTTYEGDVDITNHVVTKEEWDILPNFNDDGNKGIHKKNTLFYNIGSNFIENLFVPQGGTEIWVLTFDNFTIERAIVNEAQNQQLGLFTGQETSTQQSFIDEDVDQVKLRVKYTRQRDLDIMHHRQYLKNMNESTQIHNQSSSFVDVQSKKNNLKAISNRMGNEVREESKVWDYDQQPYELGDYKGSYVVIKTRNTYKNGTILQEYVLAENFGNINGETSLWREPSPFTRTRKNLTTNLQIEEFVEISREEKAVATRLVQTARKNVMATLDSSVTPSDPISTGVFRPIMQTANIVASNGVIMPVFTGGGGNVTTLHVQFTDTYRAGVAFSDDYEDGNFGENLVYAFPGDEAGGKKGELVNFRLFFTQAQEYLDQGRYPLVESLSNYLTFAMTDPNVVDTINKDVNSRLAVTYNEHFVTDNENVIIGNAWAKYNRLITDTPLGTKKMYKRSTPYTIYDTHTGSQDTEISGTWSVNTNDRTLIINTTEQADYYAIAYDDEILLAFNDRIFVGEPETFYINFTEQAERVIVNQLEAPGNYIVNAFPTELRVTFFNLNNESVEFEITVNDEVQTETVGPAGSTPQEIIDSSALFQFTGLDPNTFYEVQAQSIPLAGSEKVPSATALYTATTEKIPLALPEFTASRFESYDFNGTTKYTLFFDVTNNTDYELIPISAIDGFEFVYSGATIASGDTEEVGIGLLGSDQTDPNNRIDAETPYDVQFKWRTLTFNNNWDTDFTSTETVEIFTFNPPNFSSSQATARTATFVWGNPNSVSTQLEVQLLSAPFPQGTVEQTKTVSIGTEFPNEFKAVKFEGLDQETFYSTRARLLGSGFSQSSATADSPTIETNAFVSQDPPQFQLAGGITEDQMSASFKNPNGHSVTMYAQITVQGSGTITDTTEINIAGNTSDSVTFSNLEPNTGYVISAYFKETDVYSQSTTESSPTITTLKEKTEDPDILNVNQTSDTITWDVRNNDAEFATIRYGLNTQNPSITTNQVASNGIVSLSLSGLNPDTEYTIAVTAQADDKNESDLVEETTTTDNVPASQWVYIGTSLGSGQTHQETLNTTDGPETVTCPANETEENNEALNALNTEIPANTKLIGYIVRVIRFANQPVRQCYERYYEAQ